MTDRLEEIEKVWADPFVYLDEFGVERVEWLIAEVKRLREELATAAKYLLEGKTRFGMTSTTNSLVDNFIQRWGNEHD